ncbi:Uncharacterised protein [Mycobacterium tuberculosis]|nr:Uncharacterised protein [Mycobacterium tuberculosis]
MEATILAEASPTVALRWVWIIVVVATVSIIARFWLTREAATRHIDPDKRNDQMNHRGMEQGGMYTYRPGMFSHSYPPDRRGQWEEFRKDNPQPGREPRRPWPDGVLYEQTVLKDEFEVLKREPQSR